jgi:predicted hydrocarbon binding protein
LPFTELEPHPLGKLTRDEKRGLILENGSRILSFKVKTFQAFLDKLGMVAGDRVAKVLVFQMGEEIGKTGLRYSLNEIKSQNDLGKVFDVALRRRGWGRCLNLERNAKENAVVYLVKISDCPECYERKVIASACNLMRGVATGWIEGYLNKQARDSVETSCAASGDQVCSYEVIF